MKLLSLSVEHFRCVRRARVDFAPGLNVLFGPNDLGKSSLAHAIRAVLLLQHNAKEHEKFVNWSGSGEPHVELVFESEPQRIWRVRKTFGAGGSSFLDESRNGIEFSNECRGRDVDGRLREILRWGIAPPGKGAPKTKGMPESFVSTVLFAGQDQVDAIFERALAGDSDESGKKRLAEVLQAMAEDPTFRSVLNKAQEYVDLAFGSKGAKKSGKNSPWTKVREAIVQALNRYEDCQMELKKTAAIELEIQQLLDRKLQSQETEQQAQAQVAALEADLAKQKQRRQIVERLEASQARLADITKQIREVTKAEQRQFDLARLVASLQSAEKPAQDAMRVAAARIVVAENALAQLQGANRTSERVLKHNALEKRQSDLHAERDGNQSLLDRITAIEAAAKAVGGLRDQLEAAQKALRVSQEQQRELHLIGQLFRFKTAQADLEQAERSLSQIDAWREEARQKRATAVSLESSQPLFPLPDNVQLTALRRLENDLSIVAGKLDVGLAVTLRPKRDLRVTIQRDGGQVEDHQLSDDWEAGARRQIWLDIEGLAEITVAGGADEARQEMERLERRWQSKAAPVLNLAQATTIEQLAQLVGESEQRKREIQAARASAAQFEQRIGDQPDWASLLAERKERHADFEKQFGDADRAKLDKAARRLGLTDVATVEKRLETLRPRHDTLQQTAQKLATDLAVEQARENENSKALEGDWRTRQSEIAGRQAAIAKELPALEAEIEGLAAAENRGMQKAQKALEECKRDLAAAEAAHQKAADELRQACMEQASGEGSLKILRESAAKLDEKAVREAVVQVELELRSIPLPDPPVTEERLADARSRLETARADLEQISDEIQQKRGALQHVGGDVSRQRAEEAKEQLEMAKQWERNTELEYDAWELLRKTLREAEQEESGHLGRLLAGPIASRFSDLTSGRYGKLTLGPDLKTQGIAAAGGDREVELLSVGTKGQLSTLLRLTIAEQLNSAIVLDDQLTQSDTSRMLWLREFLVEIAESIQVIVLTCRPDEYVPNEAGQSAARLIDLVPLIDR